MTQSSSQPRRRFPWPLAIFPLFEIVCFVVACVVLDASLVGALSLLLAAAVGLGLAVHVFFHECIHYSSRTPLPRLFTWFASAAMGLPIDGYRIHHVNHHRYDNGLDDFSSTWQHDGEGRRARCRLSYSLTWPRQTLAAGRYVRQQVAVADGGQDGDVGPWARAIATRIPAQRRVILLVLIGLTLVSWKFTLMYLALVYLGWTAVALQNYGQHPPVEAAHANATTLEHSLYNRLLFNNGLHWEHHAQPELAWYELKADQRSPRIRWPHLMDPLVRTIQTEVTHG